MPPKRFTSSLQGVTFAEDSPLGCRQQVHASASWKYFRWVQEGTRNVENHLTHVSEGYIRAVFKLWPLLLSFPSGYGQIKEHICPWSPASLPLHISKAGKPQQMTPAVVLIIKGRAVLALQKEGDFCASGSHWSAGWPSAHHHAFLCFGGQPERDVDVEQHKGNKQGFDFSISTP